MKNNTGLKGIICALSGGILWGISGTIGQYLFMYKGVNSEWITTVRMLMAGIILLGFVGIKAPKSLLPIWKCKKDVLWLILFAIFGLMNCQYTYLTTISYSNSATATALQYLGQAFILIVTCIRMWRKPTGEEGIALILAVGGIFLLTTHGRLDSLVLSPQASFWGMGAALALMLYTLLPGSLIERYGSGVITGYGMLIGGIVLGCVTKVWEVKVTLDFGLIIGILGIVIFGTAISFTLYLQGVSEIGGVKASLFACIEPISAALTTTLWLKTSITPMDWVAFGMILLMVLCLAIPERKSKVIAEVRG